jgi:hypothetical protein
MSSSRKLSNARSFACLLLGSCLSNSRMRSSSVFLFKSSISSKLNHFEFPDLVCSAQATHLGTSSLRWFKANSAISCTNCSRSSPLGSAGLLLSPVWSRGTAIGRCYSDDPSKGSRLVALLRLARCSERQRRGQRRVTASRVGESSRSGIVDRKVINQALKTLAHKINSLVGDACDTALLFSPSGPSTRIRYTGFA